jgi:hypothetical protein
MCEDRAGRRKERWVASETGRESGLCRWREEGRQKPEELKYFFFLFQRLFGQSLECSGARAADG